MRILGIVGSMRTHKHTHTLVHTVISAVSGQKPTTSTEIIHTATKTIHPCRVTCSQYCRQHPFQCSRQDDVTGILEAMCRADALVIGAPLYFRAPPAHFHTFVERLVAMFFYNETAGKKAESPLKNKPCAIIGVAQYSNPHQVLEYLHDFCLLLGMRPVPLARFPYLGIAGQGDIRQDHTFRPFERCRDAASALQEALAAK